MQFKSDHPESFSVQSESNMLKTQQNPEQVAFDCHLMRSILIEWTFRKRRVGQSFHYEPRFWKQKSREEPHAPQDFVTEIGNRKEGVGGSSHNLRALLNIYL